jgi:hypothetical protein
MKTWIAMVAACMLWTGLVAPALFPDLGIAYLVACCVGGWLIGLLLPKWLN